MLIIFPAVLICASYLSFFFLLITSYRIVPRKPSHFLSAGYREKRCFSLGCWMLPFDCCARHWFSLPTTCHFFPPPLLGAFISPVSAERGSCKMTFLKAGNRGHRSWLLALPLKQETFCFLPSRWIPSQDERTPPLLLELKTPDECEALALRDTAHASPGTPPLTR